MVRIFKTAVMLIVGAMLGLATTWATAIRGAMGGGVDDGPWRTSPYAGSSEGGPYLRARIAAHGLLALSRRETVYYTAAHDGDGGALDGNCTYQLEGRDPPSRWWSVTVYGSDDFLISNQADRYSVSMNSALRDEHGNFAITLSKAKGDGNWIPVVPGSFDLTMRLYNPQDDVISDPAHVALPSIKKIACQ